MSLVFWYLCIAAKLRRLTDTRSLLSMPMPIILPAPSLLRIQLNQRIDPHNRHTRFYRALQLPHLTHTRLQHARLHRIHHLPSRQIQPVVLVVPLFRDVFLMSAGGGGRGGSVGRGVFNGGDGVRGGGGFGGALGVCVVGAEFGDEVGGVEGGVVEKGGGDEEESGGEGADGELFAGALWVGIGLAGYSRG